MKLMALEATLNGYIIALLIKTYYSIKYNIYSKYFRFPSYNVNKCEHKNKAHVK